MTKKSKKNLKNKQIKANFKSNKTAKRKKTNTLVHIQTVTITNTSTTKEKNTKKTPTEKLSIPT